MPQVARDKKNILWFREIGNKDVGLVGGKNASLGEMYNNLRRKGVQVPNGFAITAHAYRHFLESAGITKKIENILKGLDTTNLKQLAERGYRVRETILGAEIPKDLEEEISQAYHKLSKEAKRSYLDVAVRSSATAEDLPDASFAGQQETFLNIKGEYEVILATKRCMASLFTNRAISYREDKGFDHFDLALSVVVQRMVRSDEAVSGVMFSIDTESGFQNAILINASYGLGEMVVQGKVDPDEFYVFKPTLLEGVSLKKKAKKGLWFKYAPIVGKTLGSKKIKMIYSPEGAESVREVPTLPSEQKVFCLKERDALQLAYWACLIEDYYGKPMDIEWALDGLTGEFYIVQARPETIHSQDNKKILEEYKLSKRGKIIAEGVSVGSKIGAGKARLIKNASEIGKFKKDEVLITEITDPDWEPIMKIASAIVTNSGGRTSHAAIVSRELGIPCVVGTQNATQTIKSGQEITASCAEGERGYVYEGKIPFKIDRTDLSKLKPTKVKLMQIVADPSMVFDYAQIPNSGVGLAREEMIILNHIKIHPLALIHFDKVKDSETREKIKELTYGWKSREEFYVKKLAEGVGRIVAAYWPNPVIVRLADFKSNEYANLIGGKYFEPHEENPMLGWRGASRFYSEKYKAAFALECEALRIVREEMGLMNMWLMVPFCRTPEEGKEVLKLIDKFGLKRGSGKDRLKIIAMCEIPSNVLLADEFLKIFDGFSIGSNDLTQLTLGLDRDSSLVAHIYDERNPAIKQLLAMAIKAAKKAKKYIGICGQAPSDFPEIAEFLVDQGIDSMALTPDSVMKTMVNISKYEEKKRKKK
ncbi:phosphoenolpyruvate synthase [Patescibacteria group bacterium]|nr:phosphoenolpyruvate synthase [Patescibacteria group bacterium]